MCLLFLGQLILQEANERDAAHQLFQRHGLFQFQQQLLELQHLTGHLIPLQFRDQR